MKTRFLQATKAARVAIRLSGVSDLIRLKAVEKMLRESAVRRFASKRGRASRALKGTHIVYAM